MRHEHNRLLAVLGTGIVAAAILLANADGYHNEWTLHPNASGDFFAEPPNINWTHGWPVCFIIRHGIYSASKGKGVMVTSFSGAHGVYSRWPIDNAPLRHFKPQWLALDIVICLLLLACTFYALSRITERLRWHLQFRVKHLLLLMTVVAICMGFRQQLFPSHLTLPSRFVLQYATFAVLAIAAIISAAACLSVASRTLRMICWQDATRGRQDQEQ